VGRFFPFADHINPTVKGFLLCFGLLFKEGLLWFQFLLQSSEFCLEVGAICWWILQVYVFLVFYLKNQLFELQYLFMELFILFVQGVTFRNVFLTWDVKNEKSLSKAISIGL